MKKHKGIHNNHNRYWMSHPYPQGYPQGFDMTILLFFVVVELSLPPFLSVVIKRNCFVECQPFSEHQTIIAFMIGITVFR